jgi:IclR family acetate operon transcriptional repressor
MSRSTPESPPQTPPEKSAGETKPTLIRSVARASQILLHLAGHGEATTAKETAGAVGMHVATTYHLLNTLVAEGLVAKDSARRYTLGPKVGVLSDAFDRQLSPPANLLAGLRGLADASGETSYLSAWRHNEIVVLASIEGSHAVRVGAIHRGMRGDGHARASGKLLLAHARPEIRDAYFATHPIRVITEHTVTDLAKLEAEFEQIREQGYATDVAEYLDGVACASAPVLDGGHITAAFTISSPIQRFERDRDSLIAALLQTTSSLTP